MTEFRLRDLQYFIEYNPSLSGLFGQVIEAAGGRELDRDAFEAKWQPTDIIDEFKTIGGMLRVAKILIDVEQDIEINPNVPVEATVKANLTKQLASYRSSLDLM